MRVRSALLAMLLAAVMPAGTRAQDCSISVDAGKSLGQVSPYVYGQFIEYMGKCIDGGIYEEGSPLSDSLGIRTDVLEKVRELAPTMLRFPGGTVVKTLHWEDGVGPREQRRAKKNLVWGGINTFHFGTCEFIDYCRQVGCEPVLVVNIATGTPDEAANWVDYCNGTGDTYYANLRRQHGYPEPFHVKYWALGNEEAAEPDAGRHQNAQRYVEDMWQFIKLMKLTDPSIQLIANGESGNWDWTKTALRGLDGAVDYVSYHAYVGTDGGRPYSLFRKINDQDRSIGKFAEMVKATVPDTVRNWKKWYRFPHRTQPVRIALDEWGIWEYQEPPYGTTNTYEWRHGLATACFLNAILHNASHIAMANWAQMVNILAPIRASSTASVRQTVFYPLKEYRRQTLGESLASTVASPDVEQGLPALNVSATIDRERKSLTLQVVNISKDKLATRVDFTGCKPSRLVESTVLTAPSLTARNVLDAPDQNVVSTHRDTSVRKVGTLTLQPESVTICKYTLE